MWLEFGDDCIIWVFCINYCYDKRVNGEIDSFSRLKEDNEMILRFNGVTGNLKKRATSRFITSNCLDNTDCGNNTIDSYYLINF